MKICALVLACVLPVTGYANQDVLLLPAEVTKKFSTKNGPLLLRFDTNVSPAGIDVRFTVTYRGASWEPDAELRSAVVVQPDEATRVFAQPEAERFWVYIPVTVAKELGDLVIEFSREDIVEIRFSGDGLLGESRVRGQMKRRPNQVPEPTSGSVTPRADARGAPPPPVAQR